MTFERIGVMAGALLSVSAIAAGLGYGWPWYAHAQGVTLEQTIKDFRADEARHDAKVDSNLDLLTLGRLRDEAKAANEKAALHPRDGDAKSDAWFAQRRLDIFFKTHPSLAEAMH